MSKIIMVTGGVRSGKSEYAEQLAKGWGLPVSYIATAEIKDEEMKKRIKLHRERRPIDWETFEAPNDLQRNIEIIIETFHGDNNKLILVDCVTVYLSNRLISFFDDWGEDKEGHIIEEFKKIINTVKKNELNAIFVTNEVGFGLVPEYKMGRIFRDIAGRINKIIAESADEVYLVLAGLPKRFK